MGGEEILSPRDYKMIINFLQFRKKYVKN